MNIVFRLLKQTFAPDLYEWCKRCKKFTESRTRAVRWNGKLQHRTVCAVCETWRHGKRGR